MAGLYDRRAVIALLDNDQDTLARLLRAVEVRVGTLCPLCGNRTEDDIDMTQDGSGEAFCYACNEAYDVAAMADEVAEGGRA